jgi:hypothetical protein
MTVQGAPARLDGVDGSVVRIRFGPVDGRLYDVTTNGMTKEEATSFAGVVAVERGRPVLRDDSVLLGMEAIGSLDDFNAAANLLNLGYGGATTATVTSVKVVRRAGGVVSVASIADPGQGTFLTMARLVLGADAINAVRGLPALAADVRAVTNNDQQAVSVVAWTERGRFIVVSSSSAVDETLVTAATAHEVSEEEWAPVADQAYPFEPGFPAFIGFLATADGSIFTVSATADERTGLRLCLDGFGSDDDCAFEPDTALPMLTPMHIGNNNFIVAMVPPDDVLPAHRFPGQR